MTENVNESGFIDLSPKLERPLSLWNPLDYLRLLFWTFFFPQAVRWYVERFGNPLHRNKGRFKSFKEFRDVWLINQNLRNFFLQGLVIIIVAVPCIAFFTKDLKVSIISPTLAFSAVLGVLFVLIVGVRGGFPVGVLTGVALGVMGGVALGFTLDMVLGIVLGILLGVWLGILGGVRGGVGLGFAAGMTLGVTFGVGFGVTLESLFNLMGDVVVFIASIVIIMRLSEFIMTTLYLKIFSSAKQTQYLPNLGRIVWLPLPGIQKKLENQLDKNWEIGVQHADQLSIYSFQSIPVVRAIKSKLEQSSKENLLARVSALTTKPFSWGLIPTIVEKPISLFQRSNFSPHLDTFARTACAGFWFLYLKKTTEAVEAFSTLRNLRHGAEVYGIATAVDKGLLAINLQSINALETELMCFNSLVDSELRPGTLKALRILHSAAGEAKLALDARAALMRSTAINRAASELTQLIEKGCSFCPEPEWLVIKDIAEKWLEIFNREGGVIGEEVLRQPVLNPYEGYSGLPVTGPTFTGRNDIMRQIETHWAVGGLMPVIILYGHRRMGKTSVLRNLAQNTGPHNLYVYLDMQKTGWGGYTGQLLLDVAEALHKIVYKFYPAIGPLPDQGDYSDLYTARHSLDRVLNLIDEHIIQNQRLILAVDEFELIEEGIHKERIDPGLLKYFRALNQQYPWLGLIFAGLHTLDEMGRDYRSAFYGQAQTIRISYLTYQEALRLITQPHPDFALEYEDALIDEIYRLTYGQPYLIQLLCWELVNRWNDRFLEIGKTLPRILKTGDLAPVLTPYFFQGAGYYFDGVWGNASEAEQHLMRTVAANEKGILTREQLDEEAKQSGSPMTSDTMAETLKNLLGHDIFTESENSFSFASELMRRWVRQGAS